MGATASRSSPTTHLVTIPEYSKLLRPQTLDTIFFRDLWWDVKVSPHRFNEGLADCFIVSVEIDFDHLDSALGTDISIEILDKTGGHTVFHEESSPGPVTGWSSSMLVLSRRELEASSCVHNDSFTARCTMKHATKRRLGNFSKSKKLAVLEPQVAMAGSHTLTIDNFARLKAALRAGECTYSTHFAVGGCRWYLKLCPRKYAVFLFLVRASKDETPTTAEFSFDLEGVVNFESQKMTHTFDHANPDHMFKYGLETSTSAMHGHLVVRCCLTVTMVEKPSLPPVAIPTVIPRIESEQTPLLCAMYD